MVLKLYFVFLVAAFVQVQSVTWIQLPDHTLTYESNPFFGTTIGIQKNWWDTLQSCIVLFPNGVIYDAYPENEIPSPVTFEYSAQPFTSCVIGFRNVGVEYSGTYELASQVLHSGNNSLTMTSRRFHLTVVERAP